MFKTPNASEHSFIDTFLAKYLEARFISLVVIQISVLIIALRTMISKRLWMALLSIVLFISPGLASEPTAPIKDNLSSDTILWTSKMAWAKCDAAVSGEVPWPEDAASYCAALSLCLNEGSLTSDQQTHITWQMENLTGCYSP